MSHSAYNTEGEQDRPTCREVYALTFSLVSRCKHKCKRKCRHACCQPFSETLTEMRPDKGKGIARDTQALSASSSAMFSPQPALSASDLHGAESLLDRIDRLTADWSTDQLDDLPPLKLPENSSSTRRPNNASDISERRDAKRPRYDDLTRSQGRELCEGPSTASSSSASARPPQRRFLQALSQPSWLSKATGDSQVLQSLAASDSEPSGAFLTELNDFEMLDGIPIP